MFGRRSDVGLSPRLEGIEVIGATRASVYPGNCSQPDPIDPPGVVVHASQVRLLKTINPKRQAAVIRAGGGCCPPIQFEKMRCIADRKPIGVRPP